MAKTILDRFPAAPQGTKWWVTVLDSKAGTLGVRLTRTTPYTDYGHVRITESWTDRKIHDTLNPLAQIGGDPE